MRRAAAVTVLASGFVLGCGAPPRVVRTYVGEPHPTAELAVVRAARHGFFGGNALNVAAVAVDGSPVPVGSWIWQAPPDLELEPGTHTLTLAIDEGGSLRTLDYPRAAFRAEPGHLYELRGERVPGSVEFSFFTPSRFGWRWSVVDTTAGATVAESATASRK
jgi:hypothetical protein